MFALCPPEFGATSSDNAKRRLDSCCADCYDCPAFLASQADLRSAVVHFDDAGCFGCSAIVDERTCSRYAESQAIARVQAENAFGVVELCFYCDRLGTVGGASRFFR